MGIEVEVEVEIDAHRVASSRCCTVAPHSRESQTAGSVTPRLTPDEGMTRGAGRGLRPAFGFSTYAANLRPAVTAFFKALVVTVPLAPLPNDQWRRNWLFIHVVSPSFT